MILKQFPDIGFVRQLRNDTAKPANRWMNVVLNVRCSEVSRTGIESPYSLFLNNSGHSYCRVNKTSYRLETDTYLLTQPGEVYDLLIDNPGKTETCNVHINRDLFSNVYYSLTSASECLLSEPASAGDVPLLYTQLYRKDATMEALTRQLSTLAAEDMEAFEVTLADVVGHLLLLNEGVRNKIAALPFVRASVREDIYKRLALACDYFHSNFDKIVELGEVCTEVGMSKFHFLRVFRSFYSMTPYQYLTEVRMDKAARLLRSTDMPVTQIADMTGFAYPNSFIKAFQKKYGTSPLRYRSNK